MHVDVNRMCGEADAELVLAWVNGSEMKMLNGAGPRARKDFEIYTAVRKKAKTVLPSTHEEA